MLACDYARPSAKEKGVGLHYSHFQKPPPTGPTTYESETQKNRGFHGRTAEEGLKTSIETHAKTTGQAAEQILARLAEAEAVARQVKSLMENAASASTRDEVLAIQGEPTTFSDTYLTYGFSMVMFQDGKVVNWNNSDVKLKAKYLTATNLVPKEYFTVGSTRDEVLAIEGEPTTFSDTYLTYGFSMVMFQDGKVVNWNNSDVKLKAKYLTATNQTAEQRDQDANVNPTSGQISLASNEYPTPTQNTLNSNPNPIPTQNAKLTQEDTAYLKSQGIDPANVTVQDATQPQVNGIAFMDSFLGTTNFCVPSDNVISMKPDALTFQINGKQFDYSGHYAVMLTTPRKHKNPMFGFGSPDKAKLIIIDDFGGEAMPLPDATIWEKSSGFIDVEALGKEWIYSGTYTIQK